MKKYLIFNLLIIFFAHTNAQNITGDWQGVLNTQGIKLRIVFHITQTDNGLTTTMDSPDQGANGIPMNSTKFENSVLTVVMNAANIEYSGKFENDSIKGTFKQSGMAFPITFTRQTEKPKVIIHSQEPKKPYPYFTEDITFKNKEDSITLSGTISLPKEKGKFPVVILISGSGPQNRDEEIMGHKPFLVLSDYLTRNGIAVLRFDDRGCYKSEGDFSKATTFDFSNDVLAAVNYLSNRKDIDTKKIGLIGHSEGGIIAPIVASKNKKVSFIILMAGTGVKGTELLLKQQEDIARASGMNETELSKVIEINKNAFKLVSEIQNSDTLSSKLKTLFLNKSKLDEKTIDAQIKQISSPWMLNFLNYNPALVLEKVKCPVLAINGDLDLQVSSKINLPAIENALKKGGNNKVSLKELHSLNHLFQECKTGLPKEYSEIDQTISPVALKTMLDWMEELIKK